MKKAATSAMLVATILFTACAWKHDLTDRGDLSGIFKREYGFELPEKVTEIRGRDVRVGDTWSLWLSFSYDAETVQQIVQRGGFSRANPKGIDAADPWSHGLNSPGPNAPD